MVTQKLIKSYIQEKLTNNKQWAYRALIVIFNNQTEGEKVIEATTIDNKIGFSGAHARIMSSFAKQYNRTHSLSAKQLTWLMKIIPRYWKQLLEVTDIEKLMDAMIKDNVVTPDEAHKYIIKQKKKAFIKAL